MAILYNSAEVSSDKDILMDKWGSKTVTCDISAPKPSMCIFNNTSKALEMLNKHISLNNKIVFHTDVDVDGIGTTYIFKKTLENIGSNNHLLVINRDKIHGIQQKHVEYFKKNPIDLLIITDSSSNEIDIIKQFNCDVLCIDHHDLLHDDLNGKCLDGIHDYVIVNNTIDNNNIEIDKLWLINKNISAFENISDYKGTADMSCGLVVYELLRVYCECFSNPKLLENLMLYQWVGVTLITDVVNTLNERNQWYLDKTVFNRETESSLKIMMQLLNKYKASLDKSYIGYTFAPLINKAIRAGAGNEALSIIINRPNDILNLMKYADKQVDAINKVLFVEDSGGNKVPKIFTQDTIMIDISKFGVSANYTGVIASRVSGDNHKNAAVYIEKEDGTIKGSFRGIYNDVQYRKYFERLDKDIYAQGHPNAFGFELKKEQLEYLMSNIKSIEPFEEKRPWLTAGNMTPSEYGVYHINSIQEFKQQGYLWRLAIGNAKVVSNDEIFIRVKSSDTVLKETKGNVFIYDVLGLECKAFKILSGSYFDIYAEFTNEIVLYIK